jgi:hypothetical protein
VLYDGNVLNGAAWFPDESGRPCRIGRETEVTEV